MITTKVTKGAPKPDVEERLFKVLEGIDWKLWEIYNMMKDNLPSKPTTASQKLVKKPSAE